MRIKLEGELKAKLIRNDRESLSSLGPYPINNWATVQLKEGFDYLEMQAVDPGQYSIDKTCMEIAMYNYAQKIGKTFTPMPVAAQEYEGDVRLSLHSSGKVDFRVMGTRIGGCLFAGGTLNLMVRGFGVSEWERNRGYGVKAAKALIDYSKSTGKLMEFEVCAMGGLDQFFGSLGCDVTSWPDDPLDEYAYLVPAGQANLKKIVNELSHKEVRTGLSLKEMEEFAKKIRRRTRIIEI
jgi:hypothetical protein